MNYETINKLKNALKTYIYENKLTDLRRFRGQLLNLEKNINTSKCMYFVFFDGGEFYSAKNYKELNEVIATAENAKVIATVTFRNDYYKLTLKNVVK